MTEVVLVDPDNVAFAMRPGLGLRRVTGGPAGFAGFLAPASGFSPDFAAASGLAADWAFSSVCAMAAEAASTRILATPNSLKRGKMAAFIESPQEFSLGREPACVVRQIFVETHRVAH